MKELLDSVPVPCNISETNAEQEPVSFPLSRGPVDQAYGATSPTLDAILGFVIVVAGDLMMRLKLALNLGTSVSAFRLLWLYKLATMPTRKLTSEDNHEEPCCGLNENGTHRPTRSGIIGGWDEALKSQDFYKVGPKIKTQYWWETESSDSPNSSLKRIRGMADEKPKEGVKTENNGHINLKVAGQDGSVVQFKMKRHTPLSKLMKAYCERQCLSTQKKQDVTMLLKKVLSHVTNTDKDNELIK
ncbi:hypothetical protein U0070_027596 [Myodes glareolus]|uniref:Rad60/SUMO-like domain-containing protein n=1 Tax=Myodes glareolus TaxID=447135 RepID=A0AAW0HB52_MYOGA